jgi:hypothetical protein
MTMSVPRRRGRGVWRRSAAISALTALFVGLLSGVGSATDDPFGGNDPFDATEAGEYSEQPAWELFAIDPFGDDPLDGITGTLAEIGGPNDESEHRAGRVQIMAFFDAWPDIPGVGGFNCREKKTRSGSCPGRTRPAWSNCWSTHATGRGIDIAVCDGCSWEQSDPVINQEVGDAIVDWLLQEIDGYPAYNARRMGIMEILWHDHCWAPVRHASDRYRTSMAEMRSCTLSYHDNHLHITLTNAGADGQTSWFDDDPPPPPTDGDDIAVFYDYGAGARIHAFLSNGSEMTYSGPDGWWQIDSGYSLEQIANRMVAGDFNGDGKDDIAVFYDYGAGARIHTFLSNGSEMTYSGPDGWWQIDSGYSLEQIANRMVAGDFNG